MWRPQLTCPSWSRQNLQIALPLECVPYHAWSTYQIQVCFRRAGFKHYDSAQHQKNKQIKSPNLPTKSINPNLPRLCWLEHILQQQGTTRGRSRLRCRWHLCRGGRRSRRGLRVVRGRRQAHHRWDARATVGLEGQLIVCIYCI